MTRSLHQANLCELKEWEKSNYRDSNSVKYIFANLSDAAYKATTQEKQAVLDRSGLAKEYQIIPKYTNRDITSFWDADCQKVVMVVRGTDDKNVVGSKWRDLYTDAALAIGRVTQTSRYQEAEAMFVRLRGIYGDNIILSGHSLGGRIAGGISQKYHEPAIVFNEGASPLDFEYNRNENKYTTHFTTNSLKNISIDPISISSMLSHKKHIVPDRTWLDVLGKGPKYKFSGPDSSHTIHNFTN